MHWNNFLKLSHNEKVNLFIWEGLCYTLCQKAGITMAGRGVEWQDFSRHRYPASIFYMIGKFSELPYHTKNPPGRILIYISGILFH